MRPYTEMTPYERAFARVLEVMEKESDCDERTVAQSWAVLTMTIKECAILIGDPRKEAKPQ